jgi:putative ABC transport system permease protein
MHPTPPEKGGRIVVERVKPLWNKFSFRWKMILRSIFRNPFRSLVSIGAAAIAAALLLSVVSLYDGLVYLMNYHFQKLAHEDYTIALRDPLSIESQEEIRQLPTVSMDESQLVVACDFRNGSVSKRTPLLPLFHDSLRYFSLWKSE